MLGRTALKITQSRRVVAMGGGGIAASEASAGFGDGVQWTVYALSRGKKEEFPSLCDFAQKYVVKFGVACRICN